MRHYKDKQYAAQRLVGTVVRYKEKAVSVESISIEGSALIRELITNRVTRVKYEQLDINPVPLGYVNRLVDVIYVSRRPMRQDWRQGLRFHSIAVTDDNWEGVNPELNQIATTIEGIFPSIDECCKLLSTEEYHSRAYCRDFSLMKDGFICHKGQFKIGRVKQWLPFEYEIFDEYYWSREAFEWSLQ